MSDNFSLSFTPIKPVANKNGGEFDILIKLATPEKSIKDNRLPLNTSFVIDVSGSMEDSCGKKQVVQSGYWARKNTPKPWFPQQPQWPSPCTPPWRHNPSELICKADSSDMVQLRVDAPFDCCPGHDYYWVAEHEYFQNITKLDRVVDAVIEAISQLNGQDRFSIVAFSNSSNVVYASQMATTKNKKEAILKLKALKPGGGTALHDGWKLGAEQVCNNLYPDTVHRVLLLTDGEANVGIKDSDTLSSHTNGLAGHNVSTSTFGVGNSFNEDLLQSMADAGDGQYYYLNKPDEISATFETEFSGLSQLFAKNVQLQTTSNLGTVTLLNDLNIKNEHWVLPNGIKGQDQYMVARISLPAIKNKSSTSLVMDTVLTFKDMHDVDVVINAQFSVPLATKKVFEDSAEHPDVAKKILVLIAAKAKREAMAALDTGDYVKSRSVLRDASMLMCASAYSSALAGETESLNNLVDMADSGDMKGLRKSALYESYTTTRSKS